MNNPESDWLDRLPADVSGTVTEEQIERIEAAVGFVLPRELREFFLRASSLLRYTTAWEMDIWYDGESIVEINEDLVLMSRDCDKEHGFVDILDVHPNEPLAVDCRDAGLRVVREDIFEEPETFCESLKMFVSFLTYLAAYDNCGHRVRHGWKMSVHHSFDETVDMVSRGTERPVVRSDSRIVILGDETTAIAMLLRKSRSGWAGLIGSGGESIARRWIEAGPGRLEVWWFSTDATRTAKTLGARIEHVLHDLESWGSVDYSRA